MCPFPDISLLWDYCETRIGCLSTHKSEQYDLKRVPFTKCQTHFVKKHTRLRYMPALALVT